MIGKTVVLVHHLTGNVYRRVPVRESVIHPNLPVGAPQLEWVMNFFVHSLNVTPSTHTTHDGVPGFPSLA